MARSGGKLPKPGKLSKSWLDLIGVRAVAEARKHNLPLTADELLRDARPALAFTSKRAADKALPVGTSKFGGEPDVPTKFKWPEYEGSPLAFLAQFNLNELSSSLACRELPSTGILSIFYANGGEVIDNDDRGGWRVFFIPNLAGLVRRALPDNLTADDRMKTCQLTFAAHLTLGERDRWEVDEHYEAYYNHVRGRRLGHQLLGHFDWLQGSPAWAEKKRKGDPKYRHLFTIDSDRRAGWMWGDSGLLYFGISTDDLKAGRFDRTVFEMQCC